MERINKNMFLLIVLILLNFECLETFRTKNFKELEHKQPSALGPRISDKDEELMPGDLIEISRGPYKHWAVYAGNNNVIHLALRSKNADALDSRLKSVRHNKFIVKKDKLQDVADGDEYRIRNDLDKQYQPRHTSQILQNDESLVGKVHQYNLLTRNCEHFVTLLRYGAPQSKQDEELMPGDLIEISRGPYKHWAVYAGNSNVIHLASRSKNADALDSRLKSVRHNKFIVKKDKLQDVADGDEYRIRNDLDKQYQPRHTSQILQNAESLVGKVHQYNLLTRNCEHFVTLLRYGAPQSKQDEELMPGDLIEISRGPYKHWAVYAGNNNVIHLALRSKNADALDSRLKSVRHNKFIVKKEKLQDVVGSDEYRIRNDLDKQYQPRHTSQILQNAESLVGKVLPYNLLTRNCEHFVTLLRYGAPQSKQVQKAAVIVAVVAFVCVIIFYVSYCKRQSKVYSLLGFIFFFLCLFTVLFLVIQRANHP